MNRAELQEHIAVLIAVDWLKWAEKVIARGDNPAKLSECVRAHIVSELGNRGIGRVREGWIDETATKAIGAALQRLSAGQYKAVREHFKKR